MLKSKMAACSVDCSGRLTCIRLSFGGQTVDLHLVCTVGAGDSHLNAVR